MPGVEHLKRWQDVMEILEAGIDVLTSLNMQHIESLNDQVWYFTGVRVRETVPDWVMQAGRRGGDGGRHAARAAAPPGTRRGLCAGQSADRRWKTSSPNPT